MIPPPLPANESERIEALRQYAILDTLPEKALDELTLLAAQICDVPIALISLIDTDRQWFKAKVGLDEVQNKRELSFCAHALDQKELFVVPDATQDNRFVDNPFVTGAPGIRFYAGAPLTTPENLTLGTLCVIDRLPRVLTAAQEQALQILARQVMTHLELHRRVGELRLSEERFSNAFVHAPIGMALVSLEGHWMKVNQSICRLLGYSFEELASKTFQELTHPDDLQSDLEHVRDLVAGKTSAYHMEKRYLHKDGHTVWAELGVSLVLDKQGEPLYFISQIQDITATKVAMTRQKELTKKALAAERAKSEFLAIMSHEIRTPLNGIIGMTSILADTQLDETQRDCIDTINTSGESLLSVINDILDFSKIESGKMVLERRPFNLQKCIEESLDLFSTQLRAKGLEAAYLIASNIPIDLIGDSLRLRQIFVNLIGNAVKFTPRGGEIVLNVELHKQTEEGYLLVFSVADTGIGIAPEAVEKLFRAFQQVDTSTTRKYGGSGLGLAISKRLTELMGGAMWVESVVSKGSTFFFTALFEAAEIVTPAAAATRTTRLIKTLSILIVDDSATSRRVLETQIKSWRMISTSVPSAREALRLLAEKKFDLALIDSQLPDIDGITLCREIRQKSEIPLILLSNSRSKISEADAHVFQAQLLKPIKHSQLYQLILRLTGANRTEATPVVAHHFNASLGITRPLRILLAEDNLINQKVGLKMLERFGYLADVASNGRQAYEFAVRANYDLILMDIQMPDLDGVESLHLIKSELGERSPYIVALTAEALEGDRERFLRLGFHGYLSKPLQPAKLEEMIVSMPPTSI
jgi:PAS domain S-box-containing protein